MQGVKSWALYYGMDRSVPLDRYDLAVVAPSAWDDGAVRRLQASGTKVLAYVSVLEVPHRPGVAPPSDVLMIGSEPAEQARWNNWILDPRLPGTAARLLEMARDLGVAFDGLFLDTIGDVESALIPLSLRGRLLPATARLIAAVRERYPRLLLVQNWGLGALLDLTRPYLDAVCWEDFPPGPTQLWHTQLAERLTAMEQGGLSTLALGHSNDSAAQAWAARLGFPWYGAPGSYTAFANEEVRR